MAVTDLKRRIKSVQNKLNITETGVFDLDTLSAIEKLSDRLINTKASIKDRVQSLQSFLRCDADGIVGPETITRVENFLSTKLPQLSSGSSMHVSKKSMDMLIAFEVSSKVLYDKRYQKPIWPGGESGITIGIGYDLGFHSQSDIKAAWSNLLTKETLDLLLPVAGLSGTKAKNVLSSTQSVIINYESALSVFYQTTLPSFAKRTKRAFPGIEKLAPDAQGALLSLVYNRGESTSGSSRAEMKNIIALVAAQDLKGIAKQIRQMKRLWEGKGLPGLLDRREKEASLVENASFNILSEDIIIL